MNNLVKVNDRAIIAHPLSTWLCSTSWLPFSFRGRALFFIMVAGPLCLAGFPLLARDFFKLSQ